MAKSIKDVLTNEKFLKTALTVILTGAACLAIFLTANLVIYYYKHIKNIHDNNLVYVFNKDTVDVQFDIDINADISEQFLSYGISYGVDVSEWQGGIDWEKVAATGISFAMIRCGFRETKGSNIKEDGMFRQNIEGARAAGLNVGVYFFGTAKNEKEAIEEAEFTVNLIKDYNLTYPVVYDIESFDEGRLKYVNYSTITDNVLAFTETLGTYGYETMVYSYKNAFTYKLDTGKLDGKLIWLAHFTDATDYKGNYNMWQYTSEGRVDGINTYVDLNISYFKYVDTIDEIVNDPNYKSPLEVDFEKVDESVRVNKNSTIRNSPTYDMPNSLGSISKGTILKRIGISDKFSKVLYNDRVVYIENKSLSVIQ